MAYELLIKNASVRHGVSETSSDELVAIGISHGMVQEIGPSLSKPAVETIDAGGRLVTESFVNGHLHLCKVYTLPMVGMDALAAYHGETMGGAMTAIELASRVKEQYDESWITENARRAVMQAIRYGNTHIRALADTDTTARLEGLKALLKVREEMQDRVTLQVVAFPQDGVVRDPGAADLIREALELGADVVGGIPWIEYTDQDAQTHIDLMFELAVEYDRDVSMLIDDAGDPGLRTLEMLAVKTMETGWEGRVLVHHARAMQLYPEPYFRKITALLRRARIGVVSDPHTGPLHARVRELHADGVAVALGQDDIEDAYYPFGRNNMLEVAFLAAHLLWMTTYADMELLYDWITVRAADAMGIKDFALSPGHPANLVVLEAKTVCEAFQNHAPPAHVIRNGVDITLKTDRVWS